MFLKNMNKLVDKPKIYVIIGI